ncbi:MAG: ABC transporter permease [Actinomycetota bacterium]|nr:ABC transporter permease [Actinomycetota bacterium]
MTALRSPLALAGASLLGALVAAAVLAPALAPYDPQALAGDSLQPPSARHLLGTNNLGQDVLSQVLWGARTSLLVAVGAASLAVSAGILVGMTAGLVGGRADLVAMRVVDVFLAVPRLPLLVLVGAFVGASRSSLIVLIGAITWPVVARLLRSQTLTLRQRGFVTAARGFGGGPGYVVRRHLLPAAAPIAVSSFILIAGNAILLEAALAFLGLSDPTAVSWGLMLNRAMLYPGLYFIDAWMWWVLPAGFAITLAVMAFAFLGVGLEPVLNPRWRRGL